MDEPFDAKRLWGSAFEGDMDALIHTLKIDSSDFVHFQFNYGFCLAHKGIKEVIEAIVVLKEMYPDILYMPVCAMHDDPSSKNYVKECKDTIERLHLEQSVKMITDFLPNDESMAYLQACDMLIMPYKPTTESASGAIRFCLAAQRPIITTRQPIFDEFKDFSFQIETCDVDCIVQGIERTVEEKETQENYKKQIREYIDNISWYRTGSRIYDIFRKL